MRVELIRGCKFENSRIRDGGGEGSIILCAEILAIQSSLRECLIVSDVMHPAGRSKPDREIPEKVCNSLPTEE